MSASAAAKRKPAFAPAADPNVIPFIDVLLVLLIIFMVTAPKPTVDVQLDLSRAGRPVDVVTPPTIVDVRASRAGGYQILVNERDVDFAALGRAVLGLILDNQPMLSVDDARAEARIYVRADDEVAYGHVVAVIDELRHWGFSRIGVFAQSADES